MDKRLIRKWRKMLVDGTITPSEHMLFRKIIELEFENAQLRERLKYLGGPTKSSSQVRKKVNKVSTRNVSDKKPVPVNLETRQRDLPSNHEPTIEELCRPLSAKATPKAFRF